MNDLEKNLLAEVAIDGPWSLLEDFSTLKREHPIDVDKGMDILCEKLVGYGVPVKVLEPNLYLSLPGAAWVEANGQKFRAKPPSYSTNAPDGVSGPLIYIAANAGDTFESIFSASAQNEAETEQLVCGKIVISEGFAGPGLVTKYMKMGAVAVIGINPGVDIHWGTCTEIWGIPGLDELDRKPVIPAAAVNKADGEALIKIAADGGSVTLFTEMEEGWFKSKLPYVDIPGTDGTGDYVLLHGHLDSWDFGIGDNAVGDATMMEIARILWANKDKLVRGVRIAWWPGHSTGRYAGSTWFADEFAIDLDQHCVGHVNCDSPGCRWATEFHDLTVMSEAEDFLADVVKDVANKPIVADRPLRAGDYSFNGIGISAYLMLSSTMSTPDREEKGYYGVGGCGGNIAWHTENDLMHIADRDILERDIKIYMLAVFRNANAKVLPFDWRVTLVDFKATIDNYQKAAGDRFDLSAAKAAADDLAAALDRLYSGVASGSVAPKAANPVIKGLGRILIPINYAVNPRFTHDPALSVVRLPTIELASRLDDLEDGTLGFAQTQLVRGRNRLTSALINANALVETAL